jgi:hypothetical protein
MSNQKYIQPLARSHLINSGHYTYLGIDQIHIYTVYIRFFWQENHQIYGHIRCIYMVLANPIHIIHVTKRSLIHVQSKVALTPHQVQSDYVAVSNKHNSI